MKKFSLLILFVCLLLTNSFATQHKQITSFKSNSPLDGFDGATIFVKKTIEIKRDEIFDGKGNLYEWVGKGDCSQTEGMPPMFRLLPGSTIKNLWMKNAPDGIHVKGSNIVIDNIVNVDVCEDAISISKSKHYLTGKNIQIINSKFFHCQDKAIQLTRGSNILIKNNQFFKCAKAVRVKEQASNIIVENNRVLFAKHAIKVTGGQAIAKGNYIETAKSAFWVEKNGEIIDAGNNTMTNVELHHKQTENGKIIVEK